MIHKINNFHAVSDEGFALSARGKDVWVYSEGDQNIYVTREGGHFDGDWGETVYLSDIPNQCLTPHEQTTIPESRCKEIAENICRSLQVLGVRFRVE